MTRTRFLLALALGTLAVAAKAADSAPAVAAAGPAMTFSAQKALVIKALDARQAVLTDERRCVVAAIDKAAVFKCHEVASGARQDAMRTLRAEHEVLLRRK